MAPDKEDDVQETHWAVKTNICKQISNIGFFLICICCICYDDVFGTFLNDYELLKKC